MRLSDLARYGLWGALVATADANRREYNMATTWLPHLLTNTLTLLFPEMLRVLLPTKSSGRPAASPVVRVLEIPLKAMVRDNPSYWVYVMPLAIGYVLSHPRFNIYKGAWADIRFAGLGLDALPHAATAFALTALVCDTAETADHLTAPNDALAPFWRWCSQHLALTSLTALAAATLVWEAGEYRVHVHELALRGDVSKINMQWSWQDTLSDLAANAGGWIAALVLRR